MNTKGKAGTGATVHGSENQSITGGNLADFQFENSINIEKLQSDLTAHLVRPRPVRRLVRCHGCNQPTSPLKMSVYFTVCRACVKSLETKGASARNNFIEKVKSNVGRFLRLAVINV
jgi:ribosomal protein S14